MVSSVHFDIILFPLTIHCHIILFHLHIHCYIILFPLYSSIIMKVKAFHRVRLYWPLSRF
jgi:hypothetical protein